jgi:hypothetical protein
MTKLTRQRLIVLLGGPELDITPNMRCYASGADVFVRNMEEAEEHVRRMVSGRMGKVLEVKRCTDANAEKNSRPKHH